MQGNIWNFYLGLDLKISDIKINAFSIKCFFSISEISHEIVN